MRVLRRAPLVMSLCHRLSWPFSPGVLMLCCAPMHAPETAAWMLAAFAHALLSDFSVWLLYHLRRALLGCWICARDCL